MHWEALDPLCRRRGRVTERRRAIEASGIRVLVWVLNGPQRKQVSMEQAHSVIREEVEYGGVVLCHCINAHHRSTCSVTSFLIRECNSPWRKLRQSSGSISGRSSTRSEMSSWRS